MLSRKKEREIIILTLYSLEFSDNDVLDIIHYVANEKKITDPVTDFVKDSVNGVMNHKTEIDEVISKNLEKYTIERLSYIDLQIIRFATYEMMYFEEMASAVIINEAIELTHLYSDIGDGKAASFNNSLLDKIKNHLRP